MEFQPITADDLPLIRSYSSDPAMMQHLGGVLNEEQTQSAHASILNAIDAGYWCFKIIPEPGDDPAGTIVTWESEWQGEPVSEIGWMVLPAYQGRGIATAAVRLILDRIRDRQLFNTLHAFPATDNAASNRICDKTGFTNLGEFEMSYTGRTLTCFHWRIEL